MVKAVARMLFALLGRVVDGPADLGDLGEWSAHRAGKAEAYTDGLYQGLIASDHRPARRLDATTATLLRVQRREAHIATLRRDDQAIAAREARIRSEKRARRTLTLVVSLERRHA